MPRGIKESSSIKPVSTARWRSRRPAPARPGKAQLEADGEPHLSAASEDRSSKAIANSIQQLRSSAIIRNGQGTQGIKDGEEGEVILDHTPFYAESGGQVGDRGWLYCADHNTVVAEVKGCYFPVQGVRAHHSIPQRATLFRVSVKVDAVLTPKFAGHHAQSHRDASAASWAT